MSAIDISEAPSSTLVAVRRVGINFDAKGARSTARDKVT